MKKEIIAKFETSVDRIIKPSPKQKEEFLASIKEDKYKKLIPGDLNTKTNDCLFVGGEMWVANQANKNGHAINSASTLDLLSQIKFRPIDIEHDRTRGGIGVLLNYSLGSYPDNNEITIDDVLNTNNRSINKPTNQPFLVNGLGLVWSAMNPEFYELLSDIGSPNSPRENIASFSWELKASEFLIVVGNKFLKDSRVITDPKEEEKYSKYLREEGGSGMYNGNYVYSLLVDPIFQGVGIVRKPAADVKPIEIFNPNEEVKSIETKEIADEDSFCSTQFTLNDIDSAPILNFINQIPEEELYQEEGKSYGREDKPHITALYGIKEENPEKVSSILRDCGPISCVLGEISSFCGDDKPYDVLKVNVEGENLYSVNKMLTDNMEYENSFPEYHPHLTLAYLKKGLAAKYEGKNDFKGKKLSFSHITFSDKNRNHILLNISPEIEEKVNVISQIETASVIINTQVIEEKPNKSIYHFMKFENVTEVSANLLKAGVDEIIVKANAKFIEEELGKASENYKSNFEAQEAKNKEQAEKLAALSDNVKHMEEEKAKIMQAFKELKDKQDASEKLARFNQRMAAIDADYDMDDDDRKAIAPCASDMDDESYAKWLNATFMPLARGKKKKPMPDKKADSEDDGDEVAAKKKDVAAATDEKKVLDMEDSQKEQAKKDDKENLDKDQKKAAENLVIAAIVTAEVDKKDNVIPNGPSQIQESLKQKYAKATSLDTVFAKKKEKVSEIN